MPDDNEPTNTSGSTFPRAQPSTKPRRASVADFFRPSEQPPTSQKPPASSLSSAMAQAQQDARSRRLSITTLGLSGSSSAHNQSANAFGSLRDRGRSLGSTDANLANESAIDEDGDAPTPLNASSASNSPGIGRRMSAGARAYTDMRSSGSASGSYGSSGSAFSSVSGSGRGSPPSAKKEGFNWSESLRSRAERSSISSALPSASGHCRTRSQAEINAAPLPQPKPIAKAPDQFQERILKGDFYMD